MSGDASRPGPTPAASLGWRLARPFLFRFEAERAHDLTLAAASLASHEPLLSLLRLLARAQRHEHRVTVLGLDFRNPIGVAAGLDKNGVAVPALDALGFGFVEVGTVTPRPQAGNPRPRVFRLPDDGCLVNRMGFPNAGALAVAARLEASRDRVSCVVGLNLGKNKDTPAERAAEDYVAALWACSTVGDYLAVNVSSPNTPGLRDLQAGQALAGIVRRVVEAESAIARRLERPARPVLVKLSPDLDDASLDEALDAADGAGAAGFIAANTTLARPQGLAPSPCLAESGGLSGPPLLPRAEAMTRRVVAAFGGRKPVIAVGGVRAPEDVTRLLDAGASLVQVYTALIHAGPGLPRLLLRGLESRGGVSGSSGPAKRP